MLSHHHPLPPLHHHHRQPPKPHLPSLHFSTTTTLYCHLSPTDPPTSLPRTHNSTSTSFLHLSLHRRSNGHDPPSPSQPPPPPQQPQTNSALLDELSLVGRRRNPKFPGSLQFPRPPNDAPIDGRALREALEIRRGVVAEILKVSLQSSKLSINYSRNVVSVMPEFMDFVLIEAAAMKKVPEFAHLSFNARVRNFIEQSGVVALVKWLKHNSLSYHQIGKLICMCLGKLEMLRSTIEWLKTMHVKGEFLGKVLIKAGPIWDRGIEELSNVMGYLEENGLRRDWMGFVISRCPQVLALTMEELEKRVQFYIEMGMNEKDFGTMVYDYPRSLGAFSLEEMNCKVNYLREFGLSVADIGRLLAYKPHLIGCSIEERWKPLVKYLYYLGIRKEGMRRILVVKPMIFCVDLETTIVPKVRFLQDIGIQEEAIGATLVKFPPLLTYSLYKKIRPVVIFLMTKAGVKQRDIGKVIALEPELLGCSIVHKLDVSVKYLLSLGINLRSLGEMIADFPMLLKYNLDVLRPKYRYLRRVMVRPLQDLIEFPRFFSYSLDARIMPRHKIMVENRVNFKLRYMLAGSNEEFQKRVMDAVERRRRFESGSTGVDSISSLDPEMVRGADGNIDLELQTM